MRAALFDLDGTLLDTAPGIRRVLLEVLGELLGRPPELDLAATRSMMGDGARELVHRALRRALGAEPPPGLLERAWRAFDRRYQATPASWSPPFPGAEVALDALLARGWRLALVTNKPEGHARRLLGELGWTRRFPVLLGGDSLPLRKPDPLPLLRALEALGVPPGRALYVGDSEVDAEAARRAGLPLLALRHGYARGPVEALGAARVLDGLDELPAAAEALLPR